MNEQTAIEWLMDEIKAIDKETYATLINEGKFDKAKSINKEQITDAWVDGRKDGYQHVHKIQGEEYYNEKYNN